MGSTHEEAQGKDDTDEPDNVGSVAHHVVL